MIDNNGIISHHEKISLRIYQDGSKKIEIQGIKIYSSSYVINCLLEMANLDEFLKDYEDELIVALHTGQLKIIVELWLKFLDMCADRANSKLRDWDDIFG